MDIVYGAPQGQTGGGESWIDKLLPIGVVLAALYVMYKLIATPAATTTDSSGDTTSTANPAGTDLGSLEAYLLTLSNPQKASTPAATTTPTGSDLSSQVSSLIAALAKGGASGAAAAASPAAGVVNVNAGPASPPSYFPSGSVIGYSNTPTPAEEEETAANLLNSGITNAWWNATPTITQLASGAAGINSGGSPQSNIPAGVKHCTCTAALKASGKCGPNDDWYVC